MPDPEPEAEEPELPLYRPEVEVTLATARVTTRAPHRFERMLVVRVRAEGEYMTPEGARELAKDLLAKADVAEFGNVGKSS